ncbi:MAG: hypothetical protein J7497_02235 [Chitinophagaceae bacterium]|nr:hypothetical protein [Chitinophagaceae bacterium]
MKKEIVIENDIEFAPAHNLRAGNIELLYEPGRVRYIKFKGEEILRMIYPAIRAEDWATINGAILKEKIKTTADSFHITFEMEYEEREIKYRASYEINCSNDMLEYIMNGEALSSFKSKRVGLCVHHPIETCSGREVSILHPEGKKAVYNFPELISPVWPFTDIITMSWNTGKNNVDLTFEGDLFETEDQRNWTDDSYKTYSGPQYKTPMLDIHVHDKMRHKIVLSAAAAPGKKDITKDQSEPAKHLFPKIGYQRSAGQQKLDGTQIAQLKNIPFNHYRVDLHLNADNWKLILDEAVEEAIQINTKLELAVYFYNNDTQALVSALKNITDYLDCIHILSEDGVVPDTEFYKDIYSAIKKEFPGLKTGYGNSGWFADINSVGIENIKSDIFSFLVSPQVHQSDNRSILENLGSQHSTIETIKHRVGDKPVYVSPIVFNSRENDERLKSKFAAWWTINSICNFAEAGYLTFYELTASRGILGTAIYNLLKSIKEINPEYIYRTEQGVVVENSAGDCLVIKNSAYE